MKKNIEKEKQWLLRDKYYNKKTAGFFKDIEKIEKGEPIDYIIGWKPFLNCKIDLRFRPLSPRSETEFWAEKAIKAIKPSFAKATEGKVLDLCAGSGCIGVAVLKNIKNSQVIFGEIDGQLLNQIRLNLKLNKIPRYRYEIIKSNIFGKIKGKFDLILTNPPYVALNRKDKVEKSVLEYESHKALFAGDDGLNIIKKILKQAPRCLNENGQIWLEFDSFQKPAINKLLKQFKYKNWRFFKDQFGKWRWVMVNLTGK